MKTFADELGYTLLELVCALVIVGILSVYSISSFVPVRKQLLLETSVMQVVSIFQNTKIMAVTHHQNIAIALARHAVGDWQLPAEIELRSRTKQVVFSEEGSVQQPITIRLCLRHAASSGYAIIINKSARVRIRDEHC
jgi:prepilin-type N-terminal cleavage/methylation domain-containing protein